MTLGRLPLPLSLLRLCLERTTAGAPSWDAPWDPSGPRGSGGLPRDKPYSCARCRKGFHQCYQLLNHEHTNTRERPYKCPACAKRFRLTDALVKHLRMHTRERQYLCLACRERFP